MISDDPWEPTQPATVEPGKPLTTGCEGLSALPDELAVMHWQAGYDYAVQRILEAADDVMATPTKPAPAVDHEDRIRERMIMMMPDEPIDDYQFQEWDDQVTRRPDVA